MSDEDQYPELVQRMLKLRAVALQLQMDVVNTTIELRQRIEKNQVPLPTLIDLAFLLQEVGKYTENSEKESRKVESLIERVACAAWTVMCASDPTTPGHLQGALARGTPKAGTSANVPDRKSPEYRQLMKAAGATDENVDQDVLRLHWPHMCDWIDERLSNGQPLPLGISADTTKPRYTLHSLKLLKGVQID